MRVNADFQVIFQKPDYKCFNCHIFFLTASIKLLSELIGLIIIFSKNSFLFNLVAKSSIYEPKASLELFSN